MGYTRRKMGSKKTTSIYSRRRNYKKGSLKNRRKMTIKNGGGMARDICNVASNLILPKCFSRFNFLQTDSVAKTKSKLERMNNAETPPRFRRYMERNWENYVGTPGHINYLDQMPDMDVYRFLESDDYATIESKLETMIDPATEHSIRIYMRHKWATYVGTPGYIEFLVNTRVYNWFDWDTVTEKQEKQERMKNTEIPIDIRRRMLHQFHKGFDDEPEDFKMPDTPSDPYRMYSADLHSVGDSADAAAADD